MDRIYILSYFRRKIRKKKKRFKWKMRKNICMELHKNEILLLYIQLWVFHQFNAVNVSFKIHFNISLLMEELEKSFQFKIGSSLSLFVHCMLRKFEPISRSMKTGLWKNDLITYLLLCCVKEKSCAILSHFISSLTL